MRKTGAVERMREYRVANFFSSHNKASDIKAVLGKSWNEMYLFGLVRNPWDWQVSLFNYIRQTPTHYQYGIVNSFACF
jgi:hypothetical protein